MGVLLLNGMKHRVVGKGKAYSSSGTSVGSYEGYS